MAILVDEAQWPWRGGRWAHLVSDTSHDELHQFAQALGKRRVGFQGDHYDIDEADRRRALQAGARAVSGRELVRTLVAVGLRHRGSKPAWERLVAGSTPMAADILGPRLVGRSETLRVVVEFMAELDRGQLTVLAGTGVDAAVLDVRREIGSATVDWLRGRVDHVGVTGPRADGERSLEVFVHDGTSRPGGQIER